MAVRLPQWNATGQTEYGQYSAVRQGGYGWFAWTLAGLCHVFGDIYPRSVLPSESLVLRYVEDTVRSRQISASAIVTKALTGI